MTTIAQEQATTVPAAGPIERPVFVTDGDQRARRLRIAAVFVLVVAGLWVAGLVIGMLGLGRLPGVSLPLPGAHAKGPSLHSTPVRRPAPAVAPAQAHAVQLAERRALIKPPRSTPVQARALRAAPAAGTVVAHTHTRKPVARAAPRQGVQPAPQPAAPLRQGWARRGWANPPGQTARTEPKPVPVTPGQTRRAADPKNDVTPTGTLPPGQQNPKLDLPPKKT